MHLTQLIKHYQSDARKAQRHFSKKLDGQHEAAEDMLWKQHQELQQEFELEMRAREADHRRAYTELANALEAARLELDEARQQMSSANETAVMQQAAAKGFKAEALQINATWNAQS